MAHPEFSGWGEGGDHPVEHSEGVALRGPVVVASGMHGQQGNKPAGHHQMRGHGLRRCERTSKRSSSGPATVSHSHPSVSRSTSSAPLVSAGCGVRQVPGFQRDKETLDHVADRGRTQVGQRLDKNALTGDQERV